MKKCKLDLQHFTESGAPAETGTAGTEPQAVNEEVAAPGYDLREEAKKYGIDMSDVLGDKEDLKNQNEEEPEDPAEANAKKSATSGTEPDNQERDFDKEFSELIKGDYKDTFQNKIEGIINSRLKNHTKTQNEYKEITDNLISPLLDLYEAKDTKSLIEAIQNDENLWQSQADASGMTVEAYKAVKEADRIKERQNTETREREAREFAEQFHNQKIQEAEAAKEVYPDFEFEAELDNPLFVNLITNFDKPVKEAYEMLHASELLERKTKIASQKAKKEVADNIRARGTRPSENAISESPGSTTKVNVNNLSDEDMNTLVERARRGESIKF